MKVMSLFSGVGGFEDDWTRWGIDEKGNKVEISDGNRYTMMGNAVTVNVIEAIAERIKQGVQFN